MCTHSPHMRFSRGISFGYTLVSLLFFVFLFSTGLSSATASPSGFTGCSTGEIAPMINPIYEQQVVDLLNTTRMQYGLPAFQRVQQLDNAARYHATDMGQEGYFQHASFDRVNGQLVQVCGTWDRVRAYYNYAYAGENLAMNARAPQEAVALWMKSSGHRDNILNPSLTEVGAGFYQDPETGTTYWALDFGSPAGAHPVH